MASLREQLQDVTGLERASNAQQKLSEENQTLISQNAQLRETNLCLRDEAHRLGQTNKQLQQVVRDSCIMHV